MTHFSAACRQGLVLLVQSFGLLQFIVLHSKNITRFQKILENKKNGKTPGSDGYTAKFYKFFWTDTGRYVLNRLNEALQKGELSMIQRLGILTCLPKDNKPQEFLKNLRPITLHNIDYKLLSRVLAMRMKIHWGKYTLSL